MKKILLLFAALLTLSVTAYAQDQERIQVFQNGDWLYAINPDAEHEVTVVHYCGEEGSEATELTIPSYASNNGSRYFVTALGEYLFTENSWQHLDEYTQEWDNETFTKLEKVTIPNTVTTIGYMAFYRCTSLASVTIPNSVAKIDGWSFCDCAGLTSVTIANSVTEIGSGAFKNCTGLTSITIPSSVNKIEGNPFASCTSLQEIVVEDGNSNYTAVDGILYNTEHTKLIIYPAGKEGTFEFPNSVTEIGSDAFNGCTGLTSVTIPNSITSISDYAFSHFTGLTSVTIPNSVTEIGSGAFENCTGLTSVTIPNSVTEIEIRAFSVCTSLTNVSIPNSIKSISNSAFYGCTSLTSVTIPNSVTEIGSGAFQNCTSLTTIFSLPATPPTCRRSYSFDKVPETAVVYIPKGSFKAYFVADVWTRFTDFREMGALDISLSESTISIKEGETATLTATVTKDDDVTVESESWATSNPAIATIDNGVVAAVGEGSATISYTVVDGYGCPHTEYCTVTVTGKSGIEGIEADGSDAPAEYFNLNGARVNGDALTPGLYIKRQGSKATKVLVK